MKSFDHLFHIRRNIYLPDPMHSIPIHSSSHFFGLRRTTDDISELHYIGIHSPVSTN